MRTVILDETRSIPLAITVPVPGRRTHVLVAKTKTTLHILIKLKRSSSKKVFLQGLPEKISVANRKAFEYILSEGVPDNLEIIAEEKISGECRYTPGIIAASTASLIKALSLGYEEELSREELVEILQGVLHTTGFHEQIIHPLSLSVVDDKSIISTSLGDQEVKPNSLLSRCIVKKELSLPERLFEYTDNILLDMASKMESLLLNKINEKAGGAGEKLYYRAYNSLWYTLWSLPPTENGIYTPAGRKTVAYIVFGKE